MRGPRGGGTGDILSTQVLARNVSTRSGARMSGCARERIEAILFRASSSPPEAAARAVVAYVACDVAGSTMVETAPHLGVRPTALLHARRRGRTPLATRNLVAADLLARSRSPAGSPVF